MEIVTEIKAQKRNENRVNIYINGKYSFSLGKDHATNLEIGQELTKSEIDRLMQDEAYERVKDFAFNYISYRPRSIAETRDHLQSKGYDPEIVEAVVERLIELEYLDDKAFSRYWIEQRSLHNPRGKKALRHELRQKGVAAEISESALSEIDDGEAALSVFEKKRRSLTGLQEEEFRVKLRGYLERRGFSYATIAEVTRTVWQAMNEDH